MISGAAYAGRWDRNLLRHAMQAEGFKVYEFEWWYFDYKDWREFPMMNVSLIALAGQGR